MKDDESKHSIQLAAMDRLLREAGAYRVSKSAKVSLRKVLEDYAIEVGKKAVKFASHANRTTVKGVDIDLACKVER
jgi:histone H3/H4